MVKYKNMQGLGTKYQKHVIYMGSVKDLHKLGYLYKERNRNFNLEER